MILGLDISTSITGATVIDEEGITISCEAWDTRNKKHFPNLFAKAAHIDSKLRELSGKHSIDEIYIEQSLSRFRPGFSSAKTLLTLAKFNGIVSWSCVQVFGMIPEFVGASTARKACGIQIRRGENSKEKVLHFLLDNEPSFSVDYTKHGNPVAGSYDRADSWVIARAGFLQSVNGKTEARNS